MERELQRRAALREPSASSDSASLSLLLRALLVDCVERLAGASPSSSTEPPLLAALSSAAVWAELLLRPLMSSSSAPPSPLLLSSTARLLSACISASAVVHSPSARLFFYTHLPTALFRALQRGTGGEEAESDGAEEGDSPARAVQPSAEWRSCALSSLVAAELLLACCAALLDASRAGAKSAAAASSAAGLSSTAARWLQLSWMAVERLQSTGEEGLLLRLPLLQRLAERPTLLQSMPAQLQSQMVEAEKAATHAAFSRLCSTRRPTSTAAALGDGGGQPGDGDGAAAAGVCDASVRCAEWLLSRLLRWSRACKRSSGGSGSPPPLPPVDPQPHAIVVSPADGRGLGQWTALLVRALAAQASYRRSPSTSHPSLIALRLLHTAVVVLAQHATRSELEQQLLPALIRVLHTPHTAHALHCTAGWASLSSLSPDCCPPRAAVCCRLCRREPVRVPLLRALRWTLCEWCWTAACLVLALRRPTPRITSSALCSTWQTRRAPDSEEEEEKEESEAWLPRCCSY